MMEPIHDGTHSMEPIHDGTHSSWNPFMMEPIHDDRSTSIHFTWDDSNLNNPLTPYHDLTHDLNS